MRVMVESPFKGTAGRTESEHVKYARSCLRHSLVVMDEFPFASHLLYTQNGVLDDEVPAERLMGILAGAEWGAAAADLIVFYSDLGWSKGMSEALCFYTKRKIPCVERQIVKEERWRTLTPEAGEWGPFPKRKPRS